ncbi:hypothetical protein D3C85_1421310 [compost metagenome]
MLIIKRFLKTRKFAGQAAVIERIANYDLKSAKQALINHICDPDIPARQTAEFFGNLRLLAATERIG